MTEPHSSRSRSPSSTRPSATSPATPRRRAPRASRREADGADLVVLPELFIAGYPPEDLVLKPAFQAACRAAIEELARETADGGPAMLIGTPWVEDGKLYNACALLDGGPHRRAPLQGQSAELRRVRREAPVRARTGGGSGDHQGHPRRRSHLRGHLAGRIRRVRERRRMPGRDRRRNPGGAERLALRARQERSCGCRSRWPASPKAGCRWSISTRSAARTNWCSTAPRSRSTPIFRWRRSCRRSRRTSRRLRWTQERRPAGAARADGAAARGRQGRLRRLRAGLARLCPQERISRRAARRLRRHRFRAVRGDRGRCAGRRAGARRDAAVSLHRAGLARRCGEARRGTRHPLRGAADRGRGQRLRENPVRYRSRACRATSPRKTCRRAPAARC